MQQLAETSGIAAWLPGAMGCGGVGFGGRAMTWQRGEWCDLPDDQPAQDPEVGVWQVVRVTEPSLDCKGGVRVLLEGFSK